MITGISVVNQEKKSLLKDMGSRESSLVRLSTLFVSKKIENISTALTTAITMDIATEELACVCLELQEKPAPLFNSDQSIKLNIPKLYINIHLK